MESSTSHSTDDMAMVTDLKMENGNNQDQNSSISTSINALKQITSNTSFSTRHTASCLFSYVDESAIRLMGYLPQDLIGHSIFDFFHVEDVQLLKDIFELAVKEPGSIHRSNPYRFKIQNGCFILLESEWCCFINPWSHSFEFVMGQHRILKGCSDVDTFFPIKKETYFQNKTVNENQTEKMETESLLSEPRENCTDKKNERAVNINDSVENGRMSDVMEGEIPAGQSSSFAKCSSIESPNIKDEDMDCVKENIPIHCSSKVELPLKIAYNYQMTIPSMEDTLKKDREFLNLTSQPELVIEQFQMLKKEQETEDKCKSKVNADVSSIQDVLHLPTKNNVKSESNGEMHNICPMRNANDSSFSSDDPSTIQQMWLEENIDRFFASDPKTYSEESDESNRNENVSQRSRDSNGSSKNNSESASSSEHQHTSSSDLKNNPHVSSYSYDSGYEKSAENDEKSGSRHEGSIQQTWPTSSPNESDEKFSPFQPLTEQSLSAQNHFNHKQFKQRKNKRLLDRRSLKTNWQGAKGSSEHRKGRRAKSFMRSRTTQTNDEIPVMYKGSLEYSGYTQLTFPTVNHVNLDKTSGFQNFFDPSFDEKNAECPTYQTREKCLNERKEKVTEDFIGMDENQNQQNSSDFMESEVQAEQSPSLTRRSSFDSADYKYEDMDSEKDISSFKNSSEKAELPFEIAFRYQVTVPNMKDTLKKDQEALNTMVQPELVLQQLLMLQKERETGKNSEMNVQNKAFKVGHDPILENQDSNSVTPDISPLHDVNGSSSSSDTSPTMQQMWLEENIDRFFASHPKTCCDESDESNSNEKFDQCSQDSSSTSMNISGSPSASECQQTSSNVLKNNILPTSYSSYDSNNGKIVENNHIPCTSLEHSNKQANFAQHNPEKFSSDQHLMLQDSTNSKRQAKNDCRLGKRFCDDDWPQCNSLKHKKRMCKQPLMRSSTTQTNDEIPVMYKGTLEYSGCTQLSFPSLIKNENLNHAFGKQNFCAPSSTSVEVNLEHPIYQKNKRNMKDINGSVENLSQQKMSDSLKSKMKFEKYPPVPRSSTFEMADNKNEEMDHEKANSATKNRSDKVELPFEIVFRYQMPTTSMKDILKNDKEALKTMVQPEFVIEQFLMLQKEREAENNSKFNVSPRAQDFSNASNTMLHLPADNNGNNELEKYEDCLLHLTCKKFKHQPKILNQSQLEQHALRIHEKKDNHRWRSTADESHVPHSS